MSELKAYPVWDVPTRCFHWINALSVISLCAVGVVILNSDALDISNPAKAALKTVHVYIGYAFVLNLCWRLVWAFFGNRYARWRQMFPGGPGYWRSLRSYVASFVAGDPEHYLGHNPLGRIGVAVLLVLLMTQALTGLVLAGTDIFYPPIGHAIAHAVAAPDADPSELAPYSPEMYDKAAYERMRAVRKPFAAVHQYSFWTLLAAIILHVAAVVVTEVREGGNIVSAMFTGRKIVRGRPVDG